jgi:hypothetical protein
MIGSGLVSLPKFGAARDRHCNPLPYCFAVII